MARTNLKGNRTMGNITKATAKAAAQAAAQAAATNPLAAMAASLTILPVPAVTPHAAMLAKAAAVNNTVTVGGVAVRAANNVAARHASLNKPLAVVSAGTTYAIGKTPKLAAAYCQQNWPGIVAACQPMATGAQIQAAGTTSDFIRYALRNGWLVTA